MVKTGEILLKYILFLNFSISYKFRMISIYFHVRMGFYFQLILQLRIRKYSKWPQIVHLSYCLTPTIKSLHDCPIDYYTHNKNIYKTESIISHDKTALIYIQGEREIGSLFSSILRNVWFSRDVHYFQCTIDFLGNFVKLR